MGKLVLAALFSFRAMAALEAPSCAELNRLWEQKFHADFKIQWNEPSFKCPSPAAKLARAFFDVLTPKLPFHYYEAAKSWIHETHIDLGCDDSYAYFTDGQMHLCKGFFESDTEESAGTVVHESSHGHHDDPGHVKCKHGELQGGYACDDKLYEDFKGSGYNFEFMYYTQLLAAGNYNLLNMAVVRSYVKHEVLNNFNLVTPEQVRKWAGH